MKWKEDLTKDIRLHNGLDNLDYTDVRQYRSIYPEVMSDQVNVINAGIECTNCDKESLIEKFKLVKDKCRSILEIGVCRNGQQSFVHCLLNNKKKDTFYIGVDIEDKTYLNDSENNIHTIQTDSSNYEYVMEKCKALGVDTFDFIFIDGWHSVNQVLKDWEFTKNLSDYGIVGFHDTRSHPGPYMFIHHLDTSKWKVILNDCPNDYGIGYATKIGNYLT